MKRSSVVGLIALGTGAVGLLAAYERSVALRPTPEECLRAPDRAGCPGARSGGSGGSSGGHASSGGSGSRSAASAPARGGFGATGAAHGGSGG